MAIFFESTPCNFRNTFYICRPLQLERSSLNEKNGIVIARVAQLVEHDLAKVGVAGSNPVSRSFELEWWNR